MTTSEVTMSRGPVVTEAGTCDCTSTAGDPVDPEIKAPSGDTDHVCELAKCATDLVVAVCGIDLSGLAVFDPNGRATMVAASHNRTPDWEHLVVEPGDGIANQVLSKGGSVTLRHYEAESGSSGHLIDVYSGGEGAYGMLAVPIFQSEGIVGVLYGGLRRPEYIGDRGRTGLQNVGRLFAAGLGTDTSHAIQQMTDVVDVRDPAAPAGTSQRNNFGPYDTLTPRERTILKLLGDGMSTRSIAAEEFLAVNTVRSYVQSALWKLGAHSRLQAIAMARDLDLI